MNRHNKIACLHMNQLGDMLFSFPALYNLRDYFSDSHITSIVRSSSYELIKRTYLVDDVIIRPKSSISEYLRFIKRIRSKKFDLVLLFSTSEETWILSQLCGAKYTIGFDHFAKGMMLDKVVHWTPPPSTENDINLVKTLGCPIIKIDYQDIIQLNEEDIYSADSLLKRNGIDDNKFFIMAPGTSSGKEMKRWSDELFAETADRLFDKFGCKSIVVGLGKGESITSLSSNTIDFTGKTSIVVLCAILKRASLFVGVDSGVMHLAASMRVPVAALFGPTNENVTGPQGAEHRVIHSDVSCRPCLKKSCSAGRICMANISVDMVIDGINSMNLNI